MSESIYASPRYTKLEQTESLFQQVTVEDLKNSTVCFEYIRCQMTRFYADFDYDATELSEEQFDAVRCHANLGFRKLHHQKNSYVYTDGSYSTKEKKKLSFHVINKDISIHKPSFTWKSPYGKIMENELLENFLDKMTVDNCEVNPRAMFASALDEDVYANKVCFRLPYATSIDKPFPHIPKIKTDISDYFVTVESGERHPLTIGMMFKYQLEQDSKKAQAENLEIKRAQQPEESKDDELITEKRQKDIVELLNLVKKERFGDGGRSEWFKLLCLIKGNNLPYIIFEKISKESGYKFFSEDDCMAEWSKTKITTRLGFPTIHSWLDEDGVDWRCKEKASGFIKEMMKSIHRDGGMNADIGAGALSSLFQGSLYYIPSAKSWYYFQEKSGWEKTDEVMLLRPMMNVIGTTFSHWISETVKNPDASDEEFKKHIFFLKAVVKTIKTVKFCTDILKVACGMPEFKRQDILELFDSKSHLFCFSDMKAYNLESGKVVDIVREDFVLTTCGYPCPRFPTQVEKEAVESYIENIQPVENKESFISMQYQSCYGKNKNQFFFCHTGMGSNSKSFTTEEILVPVFGQYTGKMPIDQWTGDSQGIDRANSALASMRGKRFVYSSEPSADSGKTSSTTLKINRIKEYTGDKEIIVRSLNEKAAPMKISFTPHVLANVMPKLSKEDGGIRRRMKVFPYPRIFLQDYDEKTAEEHHRPQLQETITLVQTKEFQNAYLWRLLLSWTKNQGKYIECEDGKGETDEYLSDQNILKNWLSFYRLTTESESSMLVSDLLKDYNGWTAENDREALRIKKFTEYIRIAFVEDASYNLLRIPFIKDDKKGHRVRLIKLH